MHTKRRLEREWTKACSLKLCAGQWIVKSRFFSNENTPPFCVASLFWELFWNAISIFIQAQPVTCNEVIPFLIWSFALCDWSTQPCLIPWKCFSVCLLHCVSYRLISEDKLEMENALNCSHTCSYSIGNTILFLYSSLPTVSKGEEKTLVYSERCEMPLARLESSRPQLCGQYVRKTLLLSVSFFHSKMHTWLAASCPEGGMPGWKVSSDNSWKTDLLRFCSLERYSLKCLLVPLVEWYNLAVIQHTAILISQNLFPFLLD